MPVPAIAPLISVAMELVISLIKAAQQAKELSGKEFEEIKKKIDEEFQNIPRWEDL